MPKDYKQRPRRRGGRSFPALRLLITGLFIAGFVGFLLFIESAPRRSDPAPEGLPQAGTVTIPTRAEPVQDPQTVPPAQRDRPRFEFYTLLPEKEVYVPPAEPTPEVIAPKIPPKPPRQTAPNKSYELQVASLRDASEADTLRAKLLLLGFEARVQTARVQQQTWHRVRVGPFKGRAQADAARARLERNDLSAFIIDPQG